MEEDGGRFFGGGISQLEAEILNYVDDQEHTFSTPERIDVPWLRRHAQNLRRCIARNSELRAKFALHPQRFISSEAELDAHIKALSVLSEHPDLYPALAQSDCFADLLGLLSHDNADIAIDAIEVFAELTDDDVAANSEQWETLVEAMLEVEIVDLLVSNLKRLDERDESEMSGVYHALNVLENLCSHSTSGVRLGQHEGLLRWLIARACMSQDVVSQNQQYAAELLAILAQSSIDGCSIIIGLDPTDQLLQLVAQYRQVDPERSSFEEEYMENLFEILTCIVENPDGKVKFVESEGVELCLIMLRDGKISKQPALRLLDHASSGSYSGNVCQRLVQSGGLKILFTMFMKRDDGRTVKHLLSVMWSLLRVLPADSPERVRTLAKFVERDYEKAHKLVRHRAVYTARVQLEERRIEEERRHAPPPQDQVEALNQASERQIRELDAGLYSLQLVNVILAWLIAEDNGAREVIKGLLARDNEHLGSIKSSLKAQLGAIELKEPDSADTKNMLLALMECVP